MKQYEFSLGIHDINGDLFGKQILGSKWSMVDKDSGGDGNKVHPKIRNEICKVVAQEIIKLITPEFVNELIMSVDESWVE